MAETAKNVQEENQQQEEVEELSPHQVARKHLSDAKEKLATLLTTLDETKATLDTAKTAGVVEKVKSDLAAITSSVGVAAAAVAVAKKAEKELRLKGPFKGTLKPFDYRAIFLKNTSGLVGTLSLIKESYGIEGERIELQDEEIEFDDGNVKRFKYFEIPCEDGTKGRIYTFLLQNPELGPRYSGDLFDLNSVKKGSWILYCHQYTNKLFSMGKFKNFYPVVWHNNEEQERFIAQKMFFKDQAELMYYMYQVQKYMEERIQTRKQFRDNAIAKKEELQQRRDARREERGGSDNGERSDNRRGPRRDSDEGDRPRRDRGERGNDRPRRDDNRSRDDRPRRDDNRSRDDRPRDNKREDRPQQNRAAQPPRPNQSWATTAKGKTKQNNKPREYAPAKREGAWAIPQDEHNSEEEAYVPDQHDSGEETPIQSVPVPVPQQVPMPFYGQAPAFPSPFGYPQQMPQQPQFAPQAQFNPQQLAQLIMFLQQQPQQTGQ
jgi:hypothetical protein